MVLKREEAGPNESLVKLDNLKLVPQSGLQDVTDERHLKFDSLWHGNPKRQRHIPDFYPSPKTPSD